MSGLGVFKVTKYKILEHKEKWKQLPPQDKINIIFPNLFKILNKHRGKFAFIEVIRDTSKLPGNKDYILLGPEYIPIEDRKFNYFKFYISFLLLDRMEEGFTRVMYRIEYDFYGIKKVISPYLTVFIANVESSNNPYYIEEEYKERFKEVKEK